MHFTLNIPSITLIYKALAPSSTSTAPSTATTPSSTASSPTNLYLHEYGIEIPSEFRDLFDIAHD